jgi:hypothetical protein
MDIIKQWASRILPRSNTGTDIARAQRIAYRRTLKTAVGNAFEPDLCALCQSINIVALVSGSEFYHHDNLGALRHSARHCPSCVLILYSIDNSMCAYLEELRIIIRSSKDSRLNSGIDIILGDVEDLRRRNVVARLDACAEPG